ncbi:putative Heat shock protein 70 family [Helianthus annuus]|nr:putative Heat shock protein 70 family [Helianthus annuus]
MILTKMKDITETLLGSKVEKAIITVPAYFNDSQWKSTKDAAVFTKAKFEEVNMDLFTKCMDIVKTCLRYVNMSTDSIDEVVLVGGSTWICKIKELLKELFNGKVLYQRINPVEAVTCGVGMLAAKLSGMCDEAVQAMELIDVIPLSLCVGILNDAMVVLILEGSPIPTKKEHTFCTGYDNQTTVDITVYQGDISKYKENTSLAHFLLYGLPSTARRVVKVVVRFEIDGNWILHASAK